MKARASLLLLGLWGCTSDLPKQSLITSDRVLAIRATPPELLVPLDGGLPQAVTLEALAVDATGAAIGVRYALCDGSNPYAAGFACPGKNGIDLGGNVLDPSAPAIQAGLLALAQQAQPITLGYIAGTEVGVRTLPVRLTGVPNQNPGIASVAYALDGGSSLSPSALPEKTSVYMTPTLVPGSVETYVENGQTFTETLVYSWFNTGTGDIQNFRSLEPLNGVGQSSSELKTPAAPTTFQLFVVVRDGRGGENWFTQPLTVP